MAGRTYYSRTRDLEVEGTGSGLCSICKGAHRLCGKDRCPLMIKFYSRQKTLPLIDVKDLAGCSPPAVFVGRHGYPKVDIGPLIPPEFGDTSIMDTPERWMGMSIDQIVDFRFKLVRGKYRIDATDFRKSGRIVDNVQELALTEKPIEVEAAFSQKPTGRIIMDDEVQPFGPSARMESMVKGNGRFERNLERSYYDTDLRATEAVVNSYLNGTMISDIQKAFSVGTMGIDKNRRFVPTRWSITAVDDIIGKDLVRRTRFNETIDDYRLYRWDQLDNRWCIIMLPATWRFELIEAWLPRSSWNPSSIRVDMTADDEGFDGRSEYAQSGGAYYAARLAVAEALEEEGRTAGVVIFREIHPGYDIPLGVWNIRENVRAALKQRPISSDSMDSLWPWIESHMDIKRDSWKKNSAVLHEWKVQRRLDEFY